MKTINKNKEVFFDKKILTLGVFLDKLSDSFHQRYWSGLVEGAKKHEINLLCFSGIYFSVSNVDNNLNLINSMIGLAENSRLDAIINWASTLTWTVTRDRFSEFFKNIKNDINFLKLQVIPDKIPVTVMASYQGFKDILQHLISIHGHRRIAFIPGPENHLGAIERYRAYLDALKENDIAFDKNIVSPFPDSFSSWKEETGEKMMDYLLEIRKVNDFNAVACVSDTISFGALKSLKKNNLKVPDDIALTGFGDYPISSFKIPALTTVNPQFDEIGRSSIDLFVRMLNGEKVSQRNLVLPKLMIRQSCGCIDSLITKADFTKIENKINITDSNKLNKNEFLENIINDSSGAVSKELLSELVSIFFDEITEKSKKVFLKKIKEILNGFEDSGKDSFYLHQMISILRIYALSNFSNDKVILNAENILQQARIMIGQSAIQIQGFKMFSDKEQSLFLDEIGKELISTFNINKLMDILADKLPKAGIPSCYLSLYEDNKPPFEWAGIMLAYNTEKRYKIDTDGLRFKSSELVPESILSDFENIRFVVEPLFFHEEQLGFVLFEIGTYSGEIYEKLKSDISSAVKGALLVKEMEERTLQLDSAYKELKENQQKLLVIEKMASLGRLTAGIAHEMNTPLAAVRASMKELYMLIDEYKKSIHDNKVLPEDHEAIATDMLKHAEIAAKAAEKSAGFIRGIKGQTFSTNERISESFNAAQIIRDTLNLLEFKIKKSASKIIIDLDDSIFLTGNQHWLAQIITNLVNNAFDACVGKESVITVRFARIDKFKTELIVSDSGSGISPENISRIFDPLFTTKPFGEATGLGLSIVSELAAQFKASISVKSDPGLTVFSIVFPSGSLL